MIHHPPRPGGKRIVPMSKLKGAGDMAAGAYETIFRWMTNTAGAAIAHYT